jgi:hypothetical protein
VTATSHSSKNGLTNDPRSIIEAIAIVLHN